MSTSNAYKHIIPIFCYLFNRYWGDDATIIGYEHPNCKLPENISFHSIGRQRTQKHFSDDLAEYFSTLTEPWVWLCEDTFIKEPLKRKEYEICKSLSLLPNVGRVSLTNNSHKEYINAFGNHFGIPVFQTSSNSDYRLSMQPAIWKREYLLKYLTPGLSPWDFECQEGKLMTSHDEYYCNVALSKFDAPVTSNEGVRKRDLHKYDFNGIDPTEIQYMKKLSII